MNKKISKISLLSTLAFTSVLALPVFVHAQTFKSLVENVLINGILRPLVPLLVGLAVVVFIYGVIVFTFSEGGEKKEEAKNYMFWGIIGLFVMVSIWGMVAVLQRTFGFQNNNTSQVINITLPTITPVPAGSQ